MFLTKYAKFTCARVFFNKDAGLHSPVSKLNLKIDTSTGVFLGTVTTFFMFVKTGQF